MACGQGITFGERLENEGTSAGEVDKTDLRKCIHQYDEKQGKNNTLALSTNLTFLALASSCLFSSLFSYFFVIYLLYVLYLFIFLYSFVRLSLQSWTEHFAPTTLIHLDFCTLCALKKERKEKKKKKKRKKDRKLQTPL